MNTQAPPSESTGTAQHILNTALTLILAQGIKKVTMDEVARAAGLTRVTVYRHFSGREDLVQAVFRRIAAGFDQARQQVEDHPDIPLEAIVDLIGGTLATLPPGDFPARLDELKRVYPLVYEEFRLVRLTALEVIFERLFRQAEDQGRLRPGLQPQVVQTFFLETVVNVVENPRLLVPGLTAHDIFQTVKSIFLHGILKGD